MKSYTVITFVLGCTLWVFSQACEIENKTEITQGDNPGVTGNCSTDGSQVTCSFDDDSGWTCDGPAGTFSGDSQDNTVAYACGCQ
jgi:hypothetical protein